MALVLKDRVKETSVSTGTGAFALGGVVGPYQAFSTIGNGNTTYYAIAGQTTNEWEVGIGTYTLSTDSISRDTVLSSSNSNTIVTFSSGTKDVFITYPSEKGVWLDASDDSNSAATVGTTPVRLGATTLTLAGLDSVTLTQDPSTALQAATKQYVDTLVSSGITYHAPVKYEVPDSTGNLNATYNNGTAGVGATLTNAGTQVAFTPDGFVASVNDRILVYNQTNAAQNGVYTVTTVGSGSTNWVLTRATDADSYALKSPTALGEGDAFFITSGNTGAGETYVCNTVGTITFGTTAITFTQISATQIYSAGTGLTLSGTQFSITNTAVTAASYGAASKTLTATVNAQGQLTALADTNIAIPMSQVTSGVLGATQGGTGQSSYSIGDILYADTTTSLARLADVAVGNALISGGLNAAPAWGKIALASAVSGTLPVANGGTGVTTSTGTGDVVLSNSPTLVTPALGTPASGNFSTGTFTWPTFNQNTTGTASNVTGTVAIANGGTASTTAQGAMNTLAGATTSGSYLRGNGTNVVMATIVAGDVPTLNQNTTGTAGGLTGSPSISVGTVTTTGSVGIDTASPRQQLSVGATLDLYSGSTSSPTVPSIRGSAGNNLSLNGVSTGAVYLNYDSGTGGVNFCNGGGTVTATMSSAGGLNAVTGTFSSTVSGTNITSGGNVTGSSASCTGNAATATSAGYITNTNIGKTGAQGFISTTGWTSTDWANQAISGLGMTIASTPGAPSSNYGFFNKFGNRDDGGGWGGMWMDYNGGDCYYGSTTVSSSNATWYKLAKADGSNVSGTWGINVTGGSQITTAGSASNTPGTTSANIGVLAGTYAYIDLSTSNVEGGWIDFSKANGTDYSGRIRYVNSSDTLQFFTAASGTPSVTINSSGSFVAAGNVTAYSDERLKTNWRPVTDNFVEKLAQVKSGVYDRTDVELTQVGVSAQSLQKILPEAVTEPKDESGYLTVSYGNAALTASVELAKEVVALKELVKELKAEVDELKKAK
jgi:hypothetical protein